MLVDIALGKCPPTSAPHPRLCRGTDEGFVGELAHGLALLKRILRECGGLVVADHGDEAGAHGKGAFDQALAAVFVGLEAFEEVLGEHVAGAAGEVDAVEQVMDHHGHGDVEIEE